MLGWALRCVSQCWNPPPPPPGETGRVNYTLQYSPVFNFILFNYLGIEVSVLKAKFFWSTLNQAFCIWRIQRNQSFKLHFVSLLAACPVRQTQCFPIKPYQESDTSWGGRFWLRYVLFILLLPQQTNKGMVDGRECRGYLLFLCL